MSQALYRKYRSKSLDDVIAQDHITGILKNALKSGRIAHAYLLTGPRGVGKTSIARILAHEINELPYNEETSHLDIIEIDAASNNGVEDVRDLREKVQLAPTSAKKKVYIIDEVHMLSKAAFNALLKTLEEPPEHIVFILATTDADKLPATIVSRTQQYSFRSISIDNLKSRLKEIAEKEKIKITDDALEIIAERGDGSFRDSISLLDQVSSITNEEITAETLEGSLGLAPKKTIEKILNAVEDGDISALVLTLKKSTDDGISASILATQIAQYIKHDLISKPERLHLLDKIIEVPRSSHPEIKLLSALGSEIAPRREVQVTQPAVTKTSQPATKNPPKNAALSAPTKEISASVKELQAKGLAKKSKEKENSKPAIIERKKSTDESIVFDWNTMIEYAKENFVALYSVISKCGYEVDGSTLKLYTGNAFYKKKLDDPKYSAHLYESLDSTGGNNLEVETIPQSPPIKDSVAASVADIMGGGVEVNIDDV